MPVPQTIEGYDLSKTWKGEAGAPTQEYVLLMNFIPKPNDQRFTATRQSGPAAVCRAGVERGRSGGGRPVYRGRLRAPGYPAAPEEVHGIDGFKEVVAL